MRTNVEEWKDMQRQLRRELRDYIFATRGAAQVKSLLHEDYTQGKENDHNA